MWIQIGVEMSDICGDNRFEIIAEAKSDLLEYTNINDSPEEMAVLDSFLFRCWQMGWLKKYEVNEFEWCTGCKEYDQEKHCCHRWTKVIKQTVEEVKRQYALEYPKIIHCKDCKFYTPMNRKLKTGICSLTMHHLGDEGFCSDAEMRGDR